MDIQLKKSSIINKIKEFFDDKPDAEELSDMVLCNEASIFEPYAKKKSKKQYEQVNKTQPVISHNNKNRQFSIDDEENPVEDVFGNDKDQEQNQQQIPQTDRVLNSHQGINFEGFEEIDIRPLVSPKLVEKEPLNNPYLKGTLINYPPQSTFKIAKAAKKYEKIFDYLSGQVLREIVIDGGWIYFVRRESSDQFKVCSATPLSRLFKILIKKDEKKPQIKMAFSNEKKNPHILPRIKEFKLQNKDQQDLFFIKMRSEIQKYGFDLMYVK